MPLYFEKEIVGISIAMKKFLAPFYYRWLLPFALILMAFVWVAPAYATSLYEVPSVSDDTHIVDLADLVSRINEGKLNTTLNDLAEKTGQDVHYVTIRRLDYDETIDSFAEKLFKQWFPTSEAGENQTLIVIDSLTNNSAIATGSKVKELMSDAIAQSVSQETIQEPLRRVSLIRVHQR
jgi:uncharacterized protein